LYIDGCAEKSECENQAILQHVKYTRYECTIYTVIGQGLPELTPVEIIVKPNCVWFEVLEAGSPLTLDNG